MDQDRLERTQYYTKRKVNFKKKRNFNSNDILEETYLKVAIELGGISFLSRYRTYSASLLAKHVFPVPAGPYSIILPWSVSSLT